MGPSRKEGRLVQEILPLGLSGAGGGGVAMLTF